MMNTDNQEELHNQDDVNPTTEITKLVTEEYDTTPPKTDGTGGNRPVPTEESLIIENPEGEDTEEDTSGSEDPD